MAVKEKGRVDKSLGPAGSESTGETGLTESSLAYRARYIGLYTMLKIAISIRNVQSCEN